MIGDTVHLKPHHLPPARDIIGLIEDDLAQKKERQLYIISVGGESGSGKSTISLALQQVLDDKGFGSFIFHLDDYFRLPPRDNHEQRESDITHVGPGEVNLTLLQKHIDRARRGVKSLEKPLMHYRENKVREVIIDLTGMDVIIVEGTYVTLLEHIDCRVFMMRNYKDTYHDRIGRARDPASPFIEKVLEIEHDIIKKHASMAHILVDKNYHVARQSHNP